MRIARRGKGLLVIFLAGSVGLAADGPKSAELLAGLKKEAKEAQEELFRAGNSGAPEAKRKDAHDRYRARAVDLARRALSLAEVYPESPEAPEALAWILRGAPGGYSRGTDAECDAAYDLMAQRLLDRDAILPVCKVAGLDYDHVHAEAFLRAAVERSPNLKVRALSCFFLGHHHQQLAELVRLLDDPIRGKGLQKLLGPETVARLRKLKLDELKREAEKLFMRTIQEFPDLRPLGKDSAPLGEQAEGALFQIRNLEIGCTVPEIEAEDVDGKPLKLSDFRGKVVVISFWATWCGPCMEMVPDEKALVERMKGRPFVLLGVNGDKDRQEAKSVSAKEGITWRSFWNQRPNRSISRSWGVNFWPTVYVIDARGVIRNDGLRGPDLDRAVEALVAEAEAKKP